MERISLTRRDERTLPVNINGKDVDLTFNANGETKNEALNLLDDINQHRAFGEAMFKSMQKRSEGEIKTINALRKYANDGVELCHTLSERCARIFPTWKETVGDNFIDLEIYYQLLGTVLLICGDKETEDKLAEEIKTER